MAANELAGTVTEAARRFGDRVAVVSPQQVACSYLELDRLSDRAGAWLQGLGLQPGMRLSSCLPSSIDHLALQVGAAKVGVTFTGINPRLPLDGARDCLELLQPDLVVGVGDLLPDSEHRTVEVDLVDEPGRALQWAVSAQSSPAPVGPDEDRAMAIVLTSGTSGVPKAAVFLDRQIRAIRQLDVGTAWGGGGDMLVSTELCHVGIATKLNWYLRTGSTLHLLARWRASDALDVIERAGMTSVGGISSQFALMLRDPGIADRDLSRVQRLIAGGGPSSPALVEAAREVFGASYSIRYSSTESGGVGCATDFNAPDEEALHTVGRPRPGVELRLDEDGTVCLRSAAVMDRYFDAPERTSSTLVDGWLRTEDRGVIDDRGCLHLLGRTQDGWVRGGHNVFPEPIEAVLAQHPGVAEVAVVPRSDEVMGWVGVAVVVSTDPANPPVMAELIAHATGHLARHEVPVDVVEVERLPRNSTDKIDRRALRGLV